MVELDNYYFPSSLQKILWLGMFISFAIKVPMWPFHTWLPDAHVEAPTVGSIILAGILLKVGGYAFLRLSLPILPDASYYFANFVIILSIIAIIYTSFVALAQKDMKKMIAYSSVAHMGYVTAAIFSFTEEGIKGAIFQMVSHGIVSSALFLSIGVLYEQTKSRDINDYSFLVKSMPLYSLFFMVIVLSSIGLPGTSGFIGELMSVLGVYKYNAIYGFLIAFGLILGAIYMLKLVKLIIFTVDSNKVSNMKDLVLTENILLLIFVVSTILLGLLPNVLLEFIDVPVIKILENYKGL
jgi:NADH-quinone oxidoreductase subunit M